MSSGAGMTVVVADCIEHMRTLPEHSIDAVVCDPPYGLEFMGKEWDRPWAARPGRPAGAGMTRGGFAGGNGYATRLTPSYVKAWQNKRCVKCGHIASGGSPCVCPDPEWVIERGNTARPMQAFQAWCESWAIEALRVLKPGGHLLAFGGTRTYHRLAAGIEDAGFEIRDCLAWMYSQGFPKSLDVSKAIDKAADCPACMGRGYTRPFIGTGNPQQCDRCSGTGKATRDVIGRATSWNRPDSEAGHAARMNTSPGEYDVTAPATPEAERWQGWGTALKPAFEPVVVARKPLVGTVAANVLLHGTGALNIDGCRVANTAEDRGASEAAMSGERMWRRAGQEGAATFGPGLQEGPQAMHEQGRWPANVVLDEEAAGLLDEQTGELTSGANPTRRGSDKSRDAYGDFKGQEECTPARGADSGGASRFFATFDHSEELCHYPSDPARASASLPIDKGTDRFRYCAKASSAERNAGLDGFEERARGNLNQGMQNMGKRTTHFRNAHPTVKPVELMRWLIRLVTPPGGLVLDPFTGSGTTGVAAHLEGVEFLGIEREAEYAEIARARIEWWRANTDAGAPTDAVLKVDRDPAQLDLLGGEAA